MIKRIDFAGKKFGYLTVRELTPKIKGVRTRQWRCDCAACGLSTELSAHAVREETQATCGCRPGLTLRAYRLALEMRKEGQRLVKTMPNLSDTPDICFFLEPSGKSVFRPDAESAIEAREVEPMQDGLFADLDQTWVPVPFVCRECTYPSRLPDVCDNPRCFANPTISQATKEVWRAEHERRQTEEAERERFRQIRRRAMERTT